MQQEQITYRDLATLKPSSNNYRHGNLGAIILSLQQFGFNGALRVWREGVVKAGNHTLLALQSLKAQGAQPPHGVRVSGSAWLVACVDISHLSEIAANAFMIADNRTSELSTNDDAQLASLLSAIAAEDSALLIASGYDGDDVDDLLRSLANDTVITDVAPQNEKANELQAKWQVQRGQVWSIGKHRLMCGDSTNAEDVARLMDGQLTDAMINDPPYGMRLNADFSSAKTNLKFAAEKGAFGGKRYDNVTGDHEDYDAKLVLLNFTYVKEQFWFGADYYSATLPDTMHEGCWLVWDKRLEESADKMYGSCFELIWSKQKHKRDILRHKWAGIFGVEKELERERFHPTQKPTELIRDLIERYTDDSNVILDCYAGSGTTLVACEQLGRIGYGMEIEPKYCAVTLQRLADMGLTPRLIESKEK